MVDYILPLKEASAGDKHFGRHFQIEFVPEKSIYTIKDLGNGYGAFVRIDFPQVIFFYIRYRPNIDLKRQQFAIRWRILYRGQPS